MAKGLIGLISGIALFVSGCAPALHQTGKNSFYGRVGDNEYYKTDNRVSVYNTKETFAYADIDGDNLIDLFFKGVKFETPNGPGYFWTVVKDSENLTNKDILNASKYVIEIEAELKR